MAAQKSKEAKKTTGTQERTISIQKKSSGEIPHDPDDLGEQLRQSLEERGITPTELSRALEIGISQASRFLNKQCGLSAGNLSKICSHFGYKLSPVTAEAETKAIRAQLPAEASEFIESYKAKIRNDMQSAFQESLSNTKLEMEAPVKLPDGSQYLAKLVLHGADFNWIINNKVISEKNE